MNNNPMIRAAALQTLKGKWGLAIVLYLIYVGIGALPGMIPKVGFIATILLAVPVSYSLAIAYLKMARGEEVKVSNIFDVFTNENYVPALTTILLSSVYTILWSLLFIIPGVVKGYSYAMTPYILADTGATNNDAIEASMRMMQGHKMRLFLMDLGFFGLMALSVFTLCIGLLWVVPYWMTARAKFYQDLKDELTA